MQFIRSSIDLLRAPPPAERWLTAVDGACGPTAPAAAPSPPAAAPRRPIPSLVVLGPPASGVSSSAARGERGKGPSVGVRRVAITHLNSRPTGKSRPTDRIDPRHHDGCAHRVMGYSWSQSRRPGAAWLASYCRRTEGVDKYSWGFWSTAVVGLQGCNGR